jgi:hypothetical protein
MSGCACKFVVDLFSVSAVKLIISQGSMISVSQFILCCLQIKKLLETQNL